MVKRIQRRRTKGWRMPEGAVYVGRGSRWGNPHRVVKGKDSVSVVAPDGVHVWTMINLTDPTAALRQAHEVAVTLYVGLTLPALTTAGREHLAGRDLACWCPLDMPCHADVLLDLANEAGVA